MTSSISADWYRPDSDEYKTATSPRNSSADQRPVFVARPADAAAVATTVVEAARRGLVLQPQATGHGAGGTMDESTVLLDTGALTGVHIDVARRIGRAGAGSTWGHVNGAAWQHNLLGLAGSAATVSICGYTFGGGIGWLVRPHGLASAALRRVHFVDGAGNLRIAAEDAADAEDREALWAFRGGGGVGIATQLEFDLVAVQSLSAGYLLWQAQDLPTVAAAWADVIDHVGDSVATSFSVLRMPPDPSLPEQVRGKAAVHLAVADSAAESEAEALLRAVRGAATPVTDTWGEADLQKLVGIHLDPPQPVPALGTSRWLDDRAPTITEQLLAQAAAADASLQMVEVRNVANSAEAPDGALTQAPGSFIAHAVADLSDPSTRPEVDETLERFAAHWREADTGRAVGSWFEGAESVPDALPIETRNRVARIADAVDPDHVIIRSRFLA